MRRDLLVQAFRLAQRGDMAGAAALIEQVTVVTDAAVERIEQLLRS